MFERILAKNCQKFDNFNFEFSMSRHNAHYQSYKNAPKETLMSNPIEEGVPEEIEQKKVATRKFLKESGGTFEINKEIFEKVLAKFKGSIKRNYDVIVRADKMFQEKVYELYTCACPHLGNWSDRHEAKNMEKKVNAYPSHKKLVGLPWQTKSTMNKEKNDGLAWQKKQKKSAKN